MQQNQGYFGTISCPWSDNNALSSPTMHGSELEYITEAYNTNRMSPVGENINVAERLTCEKVGCGYAVKLPFGTAALHMAVKMAGIKSGDKVFCSDMNFGATVNPVVYEGGFRYLLILNMIHGIWNPLL